MSCSSTGVSICSRDGSLQHLSGLVADRSTPATRAAGGSAPLRGSTSKTGDFMLRSPIVITSPGFTMYDGMLTMRPFTRKWRCVTSWRACARLVGQVQAVDDVVETALEQLQERACRSVPERAPLRGSSSRTASRARRSSGASSASRAADGRTRRSSGACLPVRLLTGRGAAAFDRALFGEAAVALEEELDLFAGLAGGGFAAASGRRVRYNVTSFSLPLHAAPFRRAAAVMRNRRNVFDHRDFQAGGLQRADRGFAAGARALDAALRSTSCRAPSLCARRLRRPSARRTASTSSIP